MLPDRVVSTGLDSCGRFSVRLESPRRQGGHKGKQHETGEHPAPRRRPMARYRRFAVLPHENSRTTTSGDYSKSGERLVGRRSYSPLPKVTTDIGGGGGLSMLDN